MAGETPTMKLTAGEAEFWKECYLAALTGLSNAQNRSAPSTLAESSGKIADAAVEEVRRRASESGDPDYEISVFGRRR
jgi:hypothetical protein